MRSSPGPRLGQGKIELPKLCGWKGCEASVPHGQIRCNAHELRVRPRRNFVPVLPVVSAIAAAVGIEFGGWTVKEIRGPGQSQALVQARHVVMFLCQRELGMSAWEIVQQMLRKDITTVTNAIDNVRKRIESGDTLTMSAVAVGALAGQQARADMLRKARVEWASEVGREAAE